MRDEDLKKLPQSIEASKIVEFLDSLGIKHTEVYETVIGVRAVVIRMYATDENGRRFVGEGGKAAEHLLTIPYVGSWEKPDNGGKYAAITTPKGATPTPNYRGRGA